MPQTTQGISDTALDDNILFLVSIQCIPAIINCGEGLKIYIKAIMLYLPANHQTQK